VPLIGSSVPSSASFRFGEIVIEVAPFTSHVRVTNSPAIIDFELVENAMEVVGELGSGLEDCDALLPHPLIMNIAGRNSATRNSLGKDGI
jgi:hypothetical protein